MSNVIDRDNTGTVMTGANAENEIPDIHAEQAATEGVVRVPVRLTVNGQRYTIVIEPRMTLLDAWREELGLTGTKKACDRGECRACTRPCRRAARPLLHDLGGDAGEQIRHRLFGCRAKAG